MRHIASIIFLKIKAVRKTYHALRVSGGYAPFPALIHLIQAAYLSVFRKEEYGMMKSYDYIYFKHPEIYQTLFTNKENAALLPLINDQASIYLLRQKHLLPERLGDMGRRFLLVRQHSIEEVRKFLEEDGGYVIKPDEGAVSRGISFLYSDKGTLFHWDPAEGTRQACGDFLSLYESWRNGNMLIEEYIRQHHEMSAIFSKCVNTIYLHTVLMPDGHAELLSGLYMTYGCGTSNRVNTGNQVTIGIRPNGTLAPYGFAQKRDLYDYVHIKRVDRHPDTDVVFDGVQIPYWEEMKKKAVASAERFPEMTYIKWDMAVSETGPVVVEGNGMPGSYVAWQLQSLAERKKGIKAELSEHFRAIAFSKTLTPENIQTVNQNISWFPAVSSPQDCDTVIVLGSTKCVSRIAAAFDTFGNNAQYVLCGGNASEHLKDPMDSTQGKWTEADYMRKYLIERGVTPERIFTDNDSFNTQENLAHAAEILRQLGSQKAAIVSAWFHGRRVFHLAVQMNYLGLSEDCLCFVPAFGGQTRPDNWFQSIYGVKAIYHETQYDARDHQPCKAKKRGEKSR